MLRHKRGKSTTRYLLRKLQPDEQTVLLTAGNGDPVAGWRNIIDVYRAAYNAGYRFGMPFDTISVNENA